MLTGMAGNGIAWHEHYVAVRIRNIVSLKNYGPQGNNLSNHYEWNNGGERDVVSQRAVLSPANEANIGAVVTLARGDEKQTATIIGSSRDHQVLQQQISPKAYEVEDTAGPSVKQDEEGDFSASGTSWEPSGESSEDDDEDEVEDKKVKTEKFRRSYSSTRSGKVMKPCHRANAVNVIINNRKRKREDVKKKHDKTNNGNENKKSLPDSTRKNNSPLLNNQVPETITVKVTDLIKMKECFAELFKMMKEMKSYYKEDKTEFNATLKNSKPMIESETNKNNTLVQYENDGNASDVSVKSDESNRSDDNVLITNKYDNIAVKEKKVLKTQDNNQKDLKEEWIPIGSGKTLIHKDKFRKVNWKSYTVATRTLLLAAFPRRILATHSLTGKRSPAFQNKPAKMCLDPKIVTDVIIEITDRFNVRENLVRSIITTKCADECKMWKTRQKRKTMPSKHQENLKPAALGDNIETNQTF